MKIKKSTLNEIIREELEFELLCRSLIMEAEEFSPAPKGKVPAEVEGAPKSALQAIVAGYKESSASQDINKVASNFKVFLKKQGFKLLLANFTVRGGEVDLIMTDHLYLVFVEVRYRSDCAWVGSIDSIDEGKQRRIIRAAEYFRQQYSQYNDLQVRFDAVCFDGNQPINWIRNAFQVQ